VAASRQQAMAAAVLFGPGEKCDVDEQVGDCLGGVARRSALFVAMWGQHQRTTYTRRKQAELVGHDPTQTNSKSDQEPAKVLQKYV